MIELTEEHEKQIGKRLASILKLRRDKEHKDRFVTEWGTKTAAGLYRTIKGQIANMETECRTICKVVS